MTRFAALLAPLALIASPTLSQESQPAPEPDYATQLVVIETTMGDITVELETERAPITAANFLRYVDEDRFDGTKFYRAMHLDWGEPPNGLPCAIFMTPIRGSMSPDPAPWMPSTPWAASSRWTRKPMPTWLPREFYNRASSPTPR